MKKIIFSVFAVLAFSGVSMAKTIDIKEVVKIGKFQQLDLIPMENSDCCLYSAMDGTENVSSMHIMTDVEAYELYEFLYELCVASGSTGYF